MPRVIEIKDGIKHLRDDFTKKGQEPSKWEGALLTRLKEKCL